jgi:hypothetical protein
MVDSLSGRAEAAAVLRRIEHMGTKGVVSPLSGEVAALMVVGTARHGDDCEPARLPIACSTRAE